MGQTEQVFYDEIIKEASSGYIDCDFFIPICFGTKELVDNKLIDITKPKNFENTMIPTLIIKDRNKLTSSINKYLVLAREFYKDDIRVEDVSNKDKYIISSLLANALVTDFNDLNNLFDRHSNFLLDDSLIKLLTPKNIGYSNILKSNIAVVLNKQSVVEETPYGLDSFLVDDDDNILYQFPTVRFGISEDKAYIYAIQNKNANENKKIERILRKTGEGFDEKNSSHDPVVDPDNLYSVSPWSLVALTIAMSIIKNAADISEFIVPYFLVNRWNAVEISYQILKEQKNWKPNERLLLKKEEAVSNHDYNQRNITDKFLRNFRRLEHHFANISVENFELDVDSNLHVTVGDNYFCNNSLLDEVYTIASNDKINNLEKQNLSGGNK